MGNDESLVGWVELVGIVEGLVGRSDHSTVRAVLRHVLLYTIA